MPKIKTLAHKVREIRCELFSKQAKKLEAKLEAAKVQDEAISTLCAEAQPKTLLEIIKAINDGELSQEQALTLFNPQNKSKNKSFHPKAKASLRGKVEPSTGFSQLNWDKIGR